MAGRRKAVHAPAAAGARMSGMSGRARTEHAIMDSTGQHAGAASRTGPLTAWTKGAARCAETEFIIHHRVVCRSVQRREFHETAVCGDRRGSGFTGPLRVRRPRGNRPDRASGCEHSQRFLPTNSPPRLRARPFPTATPPPHRWLRRPPTSRRRRQRWRDRTTEGA